MTDTMHWTPCPECAEMLPVWGPDGVVPHVLNQHPDSPTAAWIREQVG